MQPQQRRSVSVTATTSDPFDGIVRLVLDAGRFGFGLDQISMTTRSDGNRTIRMVLEVQPSADCADLAERLSRHPAITDLRIAELSREQSDQPGVAASHPADERMLP
ncbi:hypothetical protein ACVIW2_008233 [Bradyrhizobium huanghuaihaiense]|uniref:Acetolactate synthase small subunit n=1 Tax=Bradyrhizobium huanghuaihaiense TaxID=990078 RepID=A0A562RJ45_9BRAD|nr:MULTISPECIES: hypothetical protein [Bradyrhizobium]TWI68386.1 hypothetical protein IQ16_04230 [Bradyrhizobium huanghuaihaiense]UWU79462.1 hypothetical protein N2603_13665 [Bradyrhizobium sp. CB3035]